LESETSAESGLVPIMPALRARLAPSSRMPVFRGIRRLRGTWRRFAQFAAQQDRDRVGPRATLGESGLGGGSACPTNPFLRTPGPRNCCWCSEMIPFINKALMESRWWSPVWWQFCNTGNQKAVWRPELGVCWLIGKGRWIMWRCEQRSCSDCVP